MFSTVLPVPLQALFLVKELEIEVPQVEPLLNYLSPLLSPYSFGAATSNKSNLFGYKRRRTEASPGLCYLVENEPVAGWMETRNYNYEMPGECTFVPTSALNDRALTIECT